METWTHLEDMPYPTAPGSYRFGTGYGAKSTPKNKPGFSLVCIRSGVKAPLLSDLSHRAKIRYGLDVVMQRPAAAAGTAEQQRYIHHSQYVPPPTAEAASVDKSMRKPLSQYALGRQRQVVDFDRLQTYHWVPLSDKKPKAPRAPDLLYRNTFGENNQSHSNLLSPRPEIRGVFGESARSPSPQRSSRRAKATTSQAHTPQLNSARTAPPTRQGSPAKQASSRPVTEGSSRPRPDTRARPETRGEQRQLSGNKLLRSLTDVNDLQPNVKPLSAGVDQRTGLDGANGCLFSQLQQSIKFVKKVERGEAIDVPRLVRPLVTECGRCRPHSKTRIETPRMRSPAVSARRDHRSAEAYLKIISGGGGGGQAASGGGDADDMKRTRSYTSMGSPAMTDIINQYMTSHERYNTPTSALQQVSDANRPLSRPSTQHSVRFEAIPAWAKAETARDDNSEIDSASRVASRVEVTSDVPEVRISYPGNDDDAAAEEVEEAEESATAASGSKENAVQGESS